MKKVILSALIIATQLYNCSNVREFVSTASIQSRENGTYYLTKRIQSKEQSISLYNGIITINTYYDSIFYSTIGTYTTSLDVDSVYATLMLEYIINISSDVIDTVECYWHANYKFVGDTLIKTNPITGYQYWVR